MGFDEAAYGTVLHREYARFKYFRLPNIKYEYVLTTWGLVLRGGEKGDGDPTFWETVKNPNTHEGNRFWKFDLAGTSCMDIITQTMGPNEHFPGMRTKMARMYNKALHVARMFKDDQEYREKALIIWSKKYKNRVKPVPKKEYIKEIQLETIEDMFKGNVEYKTAALEMHEQGKLKATDLEGTKWEIEQKVIKYINEKNMNQGMNSGPNQSNNSSASNFRNSHRSTTTNSYSHATSRTNTQTNKYGNATPHKRFGSQQGDGR